MDGVADPKDRIFCFGSNLAGRHGAGAAKDARLFHGAIYGKGIGLQGKSYAIPTKDENLRTLPIEAIQVHVSKFMAFARQNPEMEFEVTKIGCGLAGYTPADIGPLFRGAPRNCHLPREFIEAIKSTPKLEADMTFTSSDSTAPRPLYTSRMR